ncbi:MAG: TonB-dependent receptor [Bacteroidales bacterium]|nr:TonB-dependent receptor [Bacteroidales bacterium]
MLRKTIILSALLCASNLLRAQEADTLGNEANLPSLDETSFTFTESQLDEDANDSRSATVLSSGSNVFFSNASMTFAPIYYRLRGLDNKLNEVYINGMLMNDPERGNLRFTQISGLNNITRNADYSLPFESNSYCFSSVAGSTNYNMRPSQVPQGHKMSVSLANRNYTGRVMYTYGSGVNDQGWSYAGNFTMRYADIEGFKNVEGAFYNSISYYLGAEKIINSAHTVSLFTFANPTMRGSRAASTDEAYYLAGSNSYNAYIGWYNGKMRNSRVVRDFAPTAIVTWDYTPTDRLKVSTAAYLMISKYSTTKLSYGDGGSNPSPDYYNKMPSYNFDVYNSTGDPADRDEVALANWNDSYNKWTSSTNCRYIDFDKLYFYNQSASQQGLDAIYYQTQVHTDRISAGFASNARYSLNDGAALHFGISYARHKANHYQTMYDLLGAKYFHNINTYAARTFDRNSIAVQYDYRYPNQSIGEGDIFGYDYNIFVDKATMWGAYTLDEGIVHYYLTGKLGYTDTFREGKMQNGLAPNDSYGPSDKAYFMDGGAKTGITFNLGAGNVVEAGLGWQMIAPNANAAYLAPEVNNFFVNDLKCENIISSQLSYAYSSARIKANLSAYYNKVQDGAKWMAFYYDDGEAFTYMSMTGIEKTYYGAELGIRANIMSNLSVIFLSSINEAEYTNNFEAICVNSTDGDISKDVVMANGMKEDGTPLSIVSLGLEYNVKGWYLELTGNYYDRLYLSFAPALRMSTALKNADRYDAATNTYSIPEQATGDGGFMLDGSIGKNIRLKKGSLYCGLMISNILNNTNICTGGYEQSRSDLTFKDGTVSGRRVYKFSENPKKYYAWGVNGMLNFIYKF